MLKKIVSVIIPVYGREPLVDQLLSKIPSIVNNIILVWDYPDNTKMTKIESLKLTNLILLVSKKRLGVGFALQRGINKALNLGSDIIVIMAGNGKDNPNEISRLISPIVKHEYQYVQGSRYVQNGVSMNLPVIRKVITSGLAILWSVLLRKRITEVTNGFRAFDASVFKNKLIFWQSKDFSGYQFEYYLNYACINSKIKHIEVPVSKIYTPDFFHSKIRIQDGFHILSPLISVPLYQKKITKKPV